MNYKKKRASYVLSYHLNFPKLKRLKNKAKVFSVYAYICILLGSFGGLLKRKLNKNMTLFTEGVSLKSKVK